MCNKHVFPLKKSGATIPRAISPFAAERRIASVYADTGSSMSQFLPKAKVQ